jgi:hypothetical protein
MTPTNEQVRQLRREALTELIGAALSMLYADDPKEMLFALMIFRRENVDEDRDRINMDVVATMDKSLLHELMRDWLRRQTQ